MGYSFAAYSLGFIDGGRDPIAAIRPELEDKSSGTKYEDIDGLQSEDSGDRSPANAALS
jgi:hypothetical protein